MLKTVNDRPFYTGQISVPSTDIFNFRAFPFLELVPIEELLILFELKADQNFDHMHILDIPKIQIVIQIGIGQKKLLFYQN